MVDSFERSIVLTSFWHKVANLWYNKLILIKTVKCGNRFIQVSIRKRIV